jgi:pimeloyl-ACP methyl ester carboxylesterase
VTPPTASASAAPPPPPPPAEHVALDVFLDGAPAGTESWAVTRQPDGATEIAFDALLEEKGAKLKGSGTLSLAPDLTTRSGQLTLDTPEGSVRAELKNTSGAMSLTLSRGTESREVRAQKPSNLFLPQPFFVGFARLCPILDAASPALIEFPGSPLSISEHHPLTGAAEGVTMYTLERGELGRTVLACEKGELVAALDPWNGQGAARSGRKPVLDALVLATTRQKPKTPDGLVEEDLTVSVPAFGKDTEAKLGCTFMKPGAAPATPPGKIAAKGPRYPAVVFISGSGPQDRDEDTMGPGGVKLSIFKVMAIALAEKGVASLRCDDRGTAQSTGAFEQATLGTFVHDAEEVVKALRLRADVDGARVGLVGHSEGAVVAPVVARADGRMKGVLLMAAPGRPIPDIAIVQQERMLEQAGLPKDQIKKQLDAQREVLNAIRKGDPLPATVPQSERAHIEGQRAWLKSHFDHDPQQALREMPATSVLVVQGAKDLQVPSEDAELVRKGLASGKNGKAKVIVYPNLNHLFAESHAGSLTEYSDPRAEIDPTFLGDLTAFFDQAFGVK